MSAEQVKAITLEAMADHCHLKQHNWWKWIGSTAYNLLKKLKNPQMVGIV